MDKVIILICSSNTIIIGEMMKMKRKILAICTVLLMITISYGIVGAEEIQTNEQNTENIDIQLGILNEDGTFTTEVFSVTDQELIELKIFVNELMEAIQYTNSWDELENILNSFPQKGILSTLIMQLFSGIKLLKNRGFIISSGHFYKLNPLKKNQLSIRKSLIFWHFSSDKLLKDRSIIFKPLEFKVKILKGRQFGYISKFLGVYLFVSQKFPKKSYTFFMGTARNINGIQIHK